MVSPKDPRSYRPPSPSPAIDVKSQLGLVKSASYLPQPGGPTLPRDMPARSSNLAATGGLKLPGAK